MAKRMFGDLLGGNGFLGFLVLVQGVWQVC